MWSHVQGKVRYSSIKLEYTNIRRCHPLSLHARMSCTEPCQLSHDGCGHPCERLCGQPCGDCQLLLPSVTLRCGHTATMTCTEFKSGAEHLCKEALEPLTLACGHTMEILCSTKDESKLCMQKCGTVLDCGHKCLATCSKCSVGLAHPSCQDACNRLQDCGHCCPLQ